MLSSAEFVEALGRLGFPEASSLKPSDFDWAFDSTPENRDFLHFICRTLDKSNVVTAEEARAFQELKESSKPVLDEAALSKVLKSAEPSDEDGEMDSDPSQSSTCDPEEDLSIEELEEELQTLLKEKALKEQRCNKLQVFATSGEDLDQRLAASLQSARSKLNEAGASVEVENTDTNELLDGLADKLHQLASHLAKKGHQEEDGGGGAEAPSASSGPQKPAALLSRLCLDPFLQVEEQNTKNLALLLHSPLDPGAAELFEASSTQNSKAGHEEDHEEAQKGEEEERLVDFKRTEMARIQWSYMLAQYQLIGATAEEESLTAGIKWLSQFSPATDLWSSSLQDGTEEVLLKEAQLEEMIHDEDIPALLRESARSLSVPVVGGDLDLQLAKYNDYGAVQSGVIGSLLRHRASLEVVLVALEEEMKKWAWRHGELEKLRSELVKDGEATSLRAESLAQLDLELHPNPVITSKDAAFSRLLHLLQNASDHHRPDPLQTFAALVAATQAVAGSLESHATALERARAERREAAAGLGGCCRALHRTLYGELQHLFLGPQAHPAAAAGKELVFPNAQELTQRIFEVETRLQSLQQLLQEVLAEVKGRRAELDRQCHLGQERALYVLFNLDPQKLQETVEEAERKAGQKTELK
ncbi:unnamed protein product [Ophioblennius macclurei]